MSTENETESVGVISRDCILYKHTHTHYEFHLETYRGRAVCVWLTSRSNGPILIPDKLEEVKDEL